MREAKLILPTHNNQGEPLAHYHRELQRDLAHMYGGYTQNYSEGGFMNSRGELVRDRSITYHVGIGEHDGEEFVGYAKKYAKLCKQECVYVRLPDGTVVLADGVPTSEAYATVEVGSSTLAGFMADILGG